MPRLFYGNFDFEHRLADAGNEPSQALKRLNAELASSWLAIADDGDLIWTPSPIDTQFWVEAVQNQLPNVIPITSLAHVPRQTELIPWGWSDEVRKWGTRSGWQMNAPTDEAIRWANSRATSAELEQRWSVGLPDAARIESVEQFQTALPRLLASNERWVVKALFSMSARERILGRGPATAAEMNWIRRRILAQGVVFLEPWVERIEEIGMQFDVPATGSPRLMGVTPMRVDERGQYAGSMFSQDHSQDHSEDHPEDQPGNSSDSQWDHHDWAAAITVGLRAAETLQAQGYFGPLGIDAMSYRDSTGARQIRPLQDINARWTMGRLSLGWRRLLRLYEHGVWVHGAREHGVQQKDEESTGDESIHEEEVTRTIRTSPLFVGGIPCRHQSRLIFHRETTAVRRESQR